MIKQIVDGRWYISETDTHFEPQCYHGTDYSYQYFHREKLFKTFKNLNFIPREIIDIGAHIGFWARDFVKNCSKLHCFEPHPINFECLQKNLNVKVTDNDADVVLYNCALGEEEQPVYMHFVEHNTGETHVGEELKDTFYNGKFIEGKANATMYSLDSFNLSPDFIKIDVEHYEMKVLKGAKETIEKYRPYILVEANEELVENFIIDLGYENLYKDKDWLFKPL